jgi:hypothetical protein
MAQDRDGQHEDRPPRDEDDRAAIDALPLDVFGEDTPEDAAPEPVAEAEPSNPAPAVVVHDTAEAPTSTTRCQWCGAELQPGWNNCATCGAAVARQPEPVSAGASEPLPASPEQTAAPAEPAGWQSSFGGITPAKVLVAVVALIVLFNVMRSTSFSPFFMIILVFIVISLYRKWRR